MIVSPLYLPDEAIERFAASECNSPAMYEVNAQRIAAARTRLTGRRHVVRQRPDGDFDVCECQP